MAGLIIEIDVPPVGELELTENGSSASDTQRAEEMAARERIVDGLRPTCRRCRSGRLTGREMSATCNCWARTQGRISTTTQ